MTGKRFDSAGAPSAGVTTSRRQDRATDELVGICRGVLADGHVNEMEAAFLLDWIERTGAFVHEYPFNRIYQTLSTILADGAIDADESADLHDTLVRFVGGEAFDPQAGTASLSTALPLCVPPPVVTFAGRVFVVSGTFDYGTRQAVHAAITERGGKVASNLSGKVNFLVLGTLGSRDWVNSNAGRKIQAAVELRETGSPIGIVSETHWAAAL